MNRKKTWARRDPVVMYLYSTKESFGFQKTKAVLKTQQQVATMISMWRRHKQHNRTERRAVEYCTYIQLVWPVARWEDKEMYMCEHIGPPHACAVMPWGGGGTCTLSLAWEGAVMMPLQMFILFCYLFFAGVLPVS